MKLSLLDADRLIEVNNLKECTSPKLYASGNGLFDPEGIMSDEIFGYSRQDRMNTFAYIDLGGHYLHPHLYTTSLVRMCRPVVYCVSGQRKYKIVDGWFQEDENGWTGVEELYNHWDEIDWSKSTSRDTRLIKILSKLPKDRVFVTKIIIIPKGYRDIMSSGNAKGGTTERLSEINTHYNSLIRMVSMTKQPGSLSGRLNTATMNIQITLVKIYNYFKHAISGKHGLVKKYLLGKTITFGSRSVISAPTYNNERIQDNIVDLEHAAIPIAQCCAIFKPFIVSWLKNFFVREVISTPNIYFTDQNGRIITGTIEEPDVQFSDREVEKIIYNFVRNPDSRFDIITVRVNLTSSRKGPTIEAALMLRGKQVLPDNKPVTLNRPMTVADVLYLACVDVCEKRHAMISRYPVGTDKGIFFNKIRVQSTRQHIKLEFNDRIYPFYPDIRLDTPKDQVGVQFIDTCVFSNSMLEGLGGDYDGDQVSIRGIWSDEANAEAEELMNKKTTALSITGGGTRVVSKEIVNSYYELTKPGTPIKAVSEEDSRLYLSMKPDDFTLSFITKMIADTVDSSVENKSGKRMRKHNVWDTIKIPADYFFKGQAATTMTIGRFLLNKYVLEGAGVIEATGLIDKLIDKKGLGWIDGLIADLYMNDRITRKQFNAYVDRRDNLGYWLNGMLAHTISLRMAEPLPQIEKRKAELIKKHEKEIKAGNIEVMNQIETELRNYARELLKDDPGMDLYLSGDLDFDNNYKNNSIIRGPVLNKMTGKYDFIPNSYMNGLDVKDLPAHANSIVSGAYPGAIMTAKAGYLGKKLLALLQMSEADEPGTDCGTKKLIPITVTKKNASELVYSYFKGEKGLELLTPENVGSYIGKTLEFRSPMTCITPKFCSKCIGELVYKLDARQVGLFAVQLSHSDLNLALKAKHSQIVNLSTLNPSVIISDL